MTLFSLLLATVIAAGEARVQKLDGTALSGTVTALDAEQVTVQTDAGEVTVPVAELVDIAPSTAPAQAEPARLRIELADGSQLRANDYTVEGKQARMTLLGGATLELPVTAVASVMADAPSEAEREAWQQFRSAKPAADLIVLHKREALDYLEGILHDVTAEHVQFEVDGETIPARWTKVFGLVYFRPPQAEPAQALCRLADRQGSNYALAKAELSDGKLQAQLAGGGALALAWEAVARLDYSQGKILYLSDLEWDARESTRTAYLGTSVPAGDTTDPFAPQRDRALDGGALVVGQRSYAKGLALHSRTQLVYALPAGYRRFTAVAGLDDRVNARGDVRLSITGDGRSLYDATVRGREAANLDLDIAGVRRLAILVDFGADQDLADHLDLCEAKLIK